MPSQRLILNYVFKEAWGMCVGPCHGAMAEEVGHGHVTTGALFRLF